MRTRSPAPRWGLRWLQDHTRALTDTLVRLRRRPGSTALTLLVIGTTLALPAGLQTLLGDVAGAGQAWGQRSLTVTLFLKDSVDSAAGRRLAKQLEQQPGIAGTRYISKDAALAEFRRHADHAAAIDLLADNPLPASIAVQLDPAQTQAQAQALEQRLATLPEVENARMDLQWLQRLYALTAVLRRGLGLLALALSITVLVVVGNTVRLDVESRRQEIAVLKLLGAPNAFVRRPFLYAGLCYGAAGAVVAWILVVFGLAALEAPVRRLAGLYQSDFALGGPTPTQLAELLAIALALGWFGAFVTVSRHLRHIEPS